MRHVRRQRRLSWLHQALALSTLLLTLAACTAGVKTTRPADRLPDEQQVLRVAMQGDAKYAGFSDPAHIGAGPSPDEEIAHLIYPKLVTLDEQQRPVPWDATGWDVSADGLTYTLHLRAGMKWSDGAPINADAFAYSINRALSPCLDDARYSPHTLHMLRGAETFFAVLYRYGATPCPNGVPDGPIPTLIGTGADAGIVVPDPQTLVFHLERPTSSFLTLLAQPDAWAVPQRLIEAHSPAQQYADPDHVTVRPPAWEDTWRSHLLDNGPFGGDLFVLRSWAPDSSGAYGTVTLGRNETFWGAKPVLRSIEYRLSNDTSAWEAFTSSQGNVGFPNISAANTEATVQAMPGFARVLLPQATSYTPNPTKAPFDDARARQAFDLVLDRNALLADESREDLMPTYHLLLAGIAGYNAALRDPAGRSGDAALVPDLPTARRLAHAYADDRCGGELSRCPAVAVTVYHGDRYDGSITFSDRLAARAVAQWQAAFPGWPVSSSVRVCGQMCPSGAQLALGGWSAQYPWPGEFLQQLAPPDDPLYSYTPGNESATCDIPAATAALRAGDHASDMGTALAHYQTAEQVAVEQACWMPLYQQSFAYVTRGVKGYTVTPLGVPSLMSYQTMYLTK